VVELSGELWGGGLGHLLAVWATERLRSIGVTFRLGSRVTELTSGAARIGAERLPSAFTVAGIGVVPNDALASASGLGVADGIVVDAMQRTSHPAVWAAGDVASVAGRRVEHWHAARESGERAAFAMLGLPVPPIPPAWVFTEVAGATLDVIGDFDAWDEEEWVIEGRLVAFRRSGDVVALASVDGAMDADVARRLLVDGASIDAVLAAVR
jgi:hypothetical protein